jgi:predicted unusual protein kinase regulating ubiquinone biosynthesis (AarF/ABC1/UbiB family)
MSKNDGADETEKSTASGRLSRYARVSTTMGGLAARLAGEKYLGIGINRDKHAIQLTQALGNLKGPLLKVAQLLSTIPQALPQEYAQELQSLQADAPPMGWPFVRRRMAAELGRDWQSKFKSFDREAAAAASLGQVHKAVTLAGQNIACKLQYPDMESAVAADLKQLKLIFRIFQKYDNSISPEEIYKEISERLYEELDYRREARHQRLYAHMLRHENTVHVPDVLEELSTGRLLTSIWHDGGKILDFKTAPQETRDALAMNLFRAWYIPLYNYGIIHGDPHPGNYTVQKDLSINLLDFGCIRIFPPRFVTGVIMLYRALQNDDEDMAAQAYRNWGFENLTKELVDVLNIWARFLYSPILEDKKRPIGELGETVYGRDVASKVHKELRNIGGLKVPREFVFMDRAALGMGSIFLHLQAQINWFRVFNDLIADFSLETLTETQKDVLGRFGLELPDAA